MKKGGKEEGVKEGGSEEEGRKGGGRENGGREGGRGREREKRGRREGLTVAFRALTAKSLVNPRAVTMSILSTVGSDEC